MLEHEVGEATEHLRPLLRGPGLPRGEGLLGGRERAAGLHGAHARDLGDDLAARRVEDREGVAGVGIDPRSVHEGLPLQERKLDRCHAANDNRAAKLGLVTDLPPFAVWRHVGARAGFEVLFSRRDGDGHRFEGDSVGIEEGVAWSVRYTLEVDAHWRTRSAHVECASADGASEVRIEGDAVGGWRVDGGAAPHLAGCLDVDLEASACTNLLPVRRLALDVGERADAPAVYVRVPTLEVERLDQSYTRLGGAGRERYDYASPRFDFYAVLVFDPHGLVLEYPGIATRVA